MAKLKSTQIFDDNKGATLDLILAALTTTTGANSVILAGGTILKWGSIAAISPIAANSSTTITIAFPVPFPTGCEYFGAILTPAVTSDFYGVTSLVAKAKDQAQFTARNGATSQAISGGLWFALGK